MADNQFPLLDSAQERLQHRDSGGEIQYLLRAEEQILQSISGGMPLEEILHKICNALNSDIGNMFRSSPCRMMTLRTSPRSPRVRHFLACTNSVLRALTMGMTDHLDLWRCTVAFRAAPFSPKLN
jgi:hypothetical protein